MKVLFFDIYQSISRCLAYVEGVRLRRMKKKMWFRLKESLLLFGLSLKQCHKYSAVYGYRKHCRFLLTLHIEDVHEYILQSALRGGHLCIFKDLYNYDRVSCLLYLEYAMTFGYWNMICYLLHLGLAHNDVPDKKALLKYAQVFAPQDIYDSLRSLFLL